MTVVTAVLNVHDEGILAHASLLSIKGAVQEAETAGMWWRSSQWQIARTVLPWTA